MAGEAEERRGGVEVREEEVSEELWMHGGPKTPTNFQEPKGFSECFCNIHKKSQVGVPAGQGCWQRAMGLHSAVQAAEKCQMRMCEATESTRKADAAFVRLCLNLPADAYAYRQARSHVSVDKYMSGKSDIKAFNRGYCELVAMYQPFFMRVARVCGPNAYVLDVMKVLCLVGRSSMKKLKVTSVGEGCYHVTEDKSVKGMQPDAGLEFYLELVRIAKENRYARIGFDGEPLTGVLRFGSAVELRVVSTGFEQEAREELIRGALAATVGEVVHLGLDATLVVVEELLAGLRMQREGERSRKTGQVSCEKFERPASVEYVSRRKEEVLPEVVREWVAQRVVEKEILEERRDHVCEQPVAVPLAGKVSWADEMEMQVEEQMALLEADVVLGFADVGGSVEEESAKEEQGSEKKEKPVVVCGDFSRVEVPEKFTGPGRQVTELTWPVKETTGSGVVVVGPNHERNVARRAYRKMLKKGLVQPYYGVVASPGVCWG